MTDEPRFDPMREFQNLGEQITKQIERGIRTVTSGAERLPVDMYEADGHLYVRTSAIDGLIKDSIEISLEANVLTIAVQTEADATPTTARYHLQERRFGALAREIELSIPVRGQEARAKIEGGNGLLVTLPIDENAYGNITVTPVE